MTWSALWSIVRDTPDESAELAVLRFAAQPGKVDRYGRGLDTKKIDDYGPFAGLNLILLAAKLGKSRTVQALIRFGADPSCRDLDRRTATELLVNFCRGRVGLGTSFP